MRIIPRLIPYSSILYNTLKTSEKNIVSLGGTTLSVRIKSERKKLGPWPNRQSTLQNWGDNIYV